MAAASCVLTLILPRAAGAPDELTRQALLSAARNAAKLGDSNAAVAYYRRYLRAKPADDRAALELAAVLSAAGMIRESLQVYDGILARNPDHAEALRRHSALLARLKPREQATDAPPEREAPPLASAAGPADSLLQGMSSLAADGQWTAVLALYEKGRPEARDNDEVRALLVQAFLAAGEAARAREILDAMNPRSAAAHGALVIAALHFEAHRDYESAACMLQRAIDAGARQPHLYARQAKLLACVHMPDAAMRLLDSLPQDARCAPAVLLARARVLAAAGRRHEALAVAKPLEGLTAERAEALLLIAELLYGLEREAEAVEGLTSVIETPDAASTDQRLRALRMRALCLIRLGQAERALQDTEALADLAPDDPCAGVLRLLAYKAARRTAKYEQAVRDLAPILHKAGPDCADVPDSLVEALPADAWRAVLEQAPGDERAGLRLAEAELRHGRIAEAAAAYEQARLSRPDSTEALVGLLCCQVRQSQTAQARSTADALLRLDLSSNAAIAAGQALLRAGEQDRARGMLAKVSPFRRQGLDYRALAIVDMIESGRVPAAREAVRAVPGPDLIRLMVQAQLLARAADAAVGAQSVCYTVARQELAGLADSRPQDADLLLVLAAVQHRHGEHEAAAQTCRKLLETSPQDVRAVRLRAVALTAAGRLPETETTWQEYLKLRPRDALARRQAARLRCAQGRWDEAARLYGEFLRDHPEDEWTRTEWQARCAARQGRVREAVALCEQYNRRVPDDPEMREEEARLRRER